MEKQYWIQEQAPNGSYFDFAGLDPRTTKEQALAALAALAAWRKTLSTLKVRLVIKTTEPLPD